MHNRQFECNDLEPGCGWVFDGPKQSQAGGFDPYAGIKTLTDKLNKISAERDKYKKVWSIAYSKVRFSTAHSENCDDSCQYTTIGRDYCNLFNTALKMEFDDLALRCSDCLEIFGGEQ